MASDHQVCIIMLGESGVGKTSLLTQFCKNYFKANDKTTLGVDRYNKTIILKDVKIELELWDTAGQERFRTIVKKYFRAADGVLLVYDITNHETFLQLPSWLLSLRELNNVATVLIVGNKADLQHQNKVCRDAVENFAQEEGLDFCETSAKDKDSVDDAFKNLTLKVLEMKKIAPLYKEISTGETEVKRPSNTVSTAVQTEDLSIISLSDNFGANPKKKKKGCC